MILQNSIKSGKIELYRNNVISILGGKEWIRNLSKKLFLPKMEQAIN